MKFLSESARKILNDPGRIARRDQWFERLRCLFDGVPNEYNQKKVFMVGGYSMLPGTQEAAFTDPEGWMIDQLEQVAARPECPDDRFVPQCVEHSIYGVHFIDKLFGADVYYKDDQWNVRYLPTPVGQLKMPDLDHNETWALAKRAAKAFVEADVKLPLFNMPVLASVLNNYLNLYGQEGLIAMMEDEEAAAHDLQVISTLIRTLHRWFRENMPTQQLQCVCSDGRTQPPGSGQLCGCSTQLISGSLYRDMIAPLDDALLGDYARGGMIHLCGAHAQHIPVFREMKHLRAFQLNDRAALDLELYLNGLREDQIIYIVPFEGMPMEKILEISGGKRVVLVHWGNAPDQP